MNDLINSVKIHNKIYDKYNGLNIQSEVSFSDKKS